MRVLKFLAVGLLFLSINSCDRFHSGISQLWFFTYSSDSLTDKLTLTPANFIELRPDNRFTSDLGKYQSGHWSKKEQLLILIGDNGDITHLEINALKSTEMQVKIGHSVAANFDGFLIPEKEKDPFSKENNLWRKKATGRETVDQIVQRLRNHCGFWASYFNWALESEMETVDVRSTPSPIKIYGNGFTIKPYKNLPDTWKDYFYDSTDCQKANEILEDIVQTHTIAWAHTNNKYKMFISAFQQMQQFLN